MGLIFRQLAAVVVLFVVALHHKHLAVAAAALYAVAVHPRAGALDGRLLRAGEAFVKRVGLISAVLLGALAAPASALGALKTDPVEIATLRAGDVFGELALLDGAPRSATATALVASQCALLPRDAFRVLIAEEPAVRDALLASLAAELRRLTMHVEELHFLDMTGRLAARLVRLASEAGMPVEGGSVRLPPTINQGDLAAMVGCTRQSVNKLLGQFADDRLVRLEREGVHRHRHAGARGAFPPLTAAPGRRLRSRAADCDLAPLTATSWR